jgi:hypothetical protein
MSKDKRGLGDLEFAGKAKTQTLKQYQQENLIKAKVMPASKLAEAKDLEIQRSRDFEASIEDEGRHRKAAITAPEDKLKNLPLTRERFKE